MTSGDERGLAEIDSAVAQRYEFVRREHEFWNLLEQSLRVDIATNSRISHARQIAGMGWDGSAPPAATAESWEIASCSVNHDDRLIGEVVVNGWLKWDSDRNEWARQELEGSLFIYVDMTPALQAPRILKLWHLPFAREATDIVLSNNRTEALWRASAGDGEFDASK
ncbi:MAG: hypothetical protein ACTS22_02105 [Phycisphaerales bacterium]